MSEPLRHGDGYFERSAGDGFEKSSPTPDAEWWSLFADAQRPRRVRRQIAVAVASASVVAVALVVVAWLLMHVSDAPVSRSVAETTSPGTDANPADEARLLRLLPRGYAADACAPAPTPEGALAEVLCSQGVDAGGPVSATFTVLRDNSALATTFDAIVRRIQIVNCPGKIQSPGPWHTNAEPGRSKGTVACGLDAGVPTVVWTNNDELLINAVRAGQHDSPLDDLYRWWSAQP